MTEGPRLSRPSGAVTMSASPASASGGSRTYRDWHKDTVGLIKSLCQTDLEGARPHHEVRVLDVAHERVPGRAARERVGRGPFVRVLGTV